MSVELSVSQKNNPDYCWEIIQKLKKSAVDCKIGSNLSLVDNEIENGCVITLPHAFHDKTKLAELWKDTFGKGCAHLKIPGIFSGCILNYIN